MIQNFSSDQNFIYVLLKTILITVPLYSIDVIEAVVLYPGWTDYRLKQTAQALIYLSCIWEVPSSNLGWDTDYRT